MIDDIKKQIADDEEILNILPQNNASNRKKYASKLDELIKKYSEDKEDIYNYIVAKNTLLKKKYNQHYEDMYTKKIGELYNKVKLFNKYQDSYEILSIDILFYNLHKYYNNDLDFYNDNINKILNIFEKAGVNLKYSDFYFDESAMEYMKVFLEERKNNYNSTVVKESFEKLFWKSHNMMRNILINFKHLYYENEKKFNDYVDKCKKEVLLEYASFDKLLLSYQNLIIQKNNQYRDSIGMYYKRFIDKELATKDYEKDKIDRQVDEFIIGKQSDSEKKEIFIKFLNSLEEEKFIYDYKFVLDEVDKLYQEKDTYKNLVSTSMKEIRGLEKNILKKRKKINSKSLFKKKDKDVILNSEIDVILNELDEKYELLDENRYKEKTLLMISPSIKDYYLIGKSYLFLNHVLKEHEDLVIDEVIKRIDENIYSPYNLVIDNIDYKAVENLNLIIYDKYRLIGVNIITDNLLYDNLDSMIKTVDNIIIYYCLSKLNYKLYEIDFIMKSDEIIKKTSNY